MAERVRELHIPVPHRPEAPFNCRCTDLPPAESPRIEYFVLEEWSDHTIRHPTTGRRVDLFVYMRFSEMAERFLRGLDDKLGEGQ